MYSPRISEDLIPVLYKKAKQANLPMTKYVDALIRDALKDDEPIKVKCLCSNCLSEVETDEYQTEVYCDFCQSLNFLKREA